MVLVAFAVGKSLSLWQRENLELLGCLRIIGRAGGRDGRKSLSSNCSKSLGRVVGHNNKSNLALQSVKMAWIDLGYHTASFMFRYFSTSSGVKSAYQYQV